VGTSPGGGQVKAFYTIPANSQYHTVSGLNLNGYRQVSDKKLRSLLYYIEKGLFLLHLFIEYVLYKIKTGDQHLEVKSRVDSHE
jgi:hypothetical protein